MNKAAKKIVPFALIISLMTPITASAVTQTPLVTQQICLVEQQSTLVEAKEKPKPEPEPELVIKEDKEETVQEKSSSKQQAPTDASVSDRELLYHLVEHEIGSGSLEHKRIIAQVIINRVNSPKFPDTIRGVIYAPGQFSGVGEIMYMTPDAETIQAVDEVLDGECEDNSQGAVYFYNPRYVGGSTKRWFESLDFLFEMEGHRFFK